MKSFKNSFLFTHRGELKTLQIFVKNLSAPSFVIVFVKEMAINGKRCLAGQAEIIHKNPFNYRFQVNRI